MNIFVRLILGLLAAGCTGKMGLPVPTPQAIEFYGTGSHGSSGGASGMAWFPHGNRKIGYCIFDSAEGPEKDLVRKAFEQGFSLVSDYYVSKRAQDALPMEQRLASSIQETDCANADLVLYPGTLDDAPGLSEFDRLALRAGRSGLNQPPSFQFRTDNPREARTWAKGYIWLAPFALVNEQEFAWRLVPLIGALAHEIGHIFGIPHIPGTLMANSYTKRLLELAYIEKVSDRALSDSYLQMDGRAELFACESHHCPLQNFHGTLGETLAESQEVFERITGRAPTGPISARLYVRRFPGFDESTWLPAKSIVWGGSVADSLNSHRIFFEVDHHPLDVRTGLELFRNLWATDPILFGGTSFQARLHTLAGERIPIDIQRNHNPLNGKGNRFSVSDWDGHTFFSTHTHDSLLNTFSIVKPDLKITAVAVKDESHLAVTVTNLGTVPTWGTNVTARRDGTWVGTVWLPALKPTEVATVSLPLSGTNRKADPSELTLSDMGLGSEQVSVVWGDERMQVFRDQLFLPKASDFDPKLRSPVVIEVDAWNSVLESDEANNTFVWSF